MPRRTKILATLGPASSDRQTLARMIAAGMDVFLLKPIDAPELLAAIEGVLRQPAAPPDSAVVMAQLRASLLRTFAAEAPAQTPISHLPTSTAAVSILSANYTAAINERVAQIEATIQVWLSRQYSIRVRMVPGTSSSLRFTGMESAGSSVSTSITT